MDIIDRLANEPKRVNEAVDAIWEQLKQKTSGPSEGVIAVALVFCRLLALGNLGEEHAHALIAALFARRRAGKLVTAERAADVEGVRADKAQRRCGGCGFVGTQNEMNNHWDGIGSSCVQIAEVVEDEAAK